MNDYICLTATHDNAVYRINKDLIGFWKAQPSGVTVVHTIIAVNSQGPDGQLHHGPMTLEVRESVHDVDQLMGIPVPHPVFGDPPPEEAN